MRTDTIQRPDPFAEIRVHTLHAVRGANFWSRHPVIRLDVDIGAYEEISSADAPLFTEQLVRALPLLEEHRCSIGTRGGFIQRLRTGTYAAHIIEHVAIALQELAGYDVGFGQTRGSGVVGGYTIVFEYMHEGVALRAATLALDTVQRAFAGTLNSVDNAIAELKLLSGAPAVASVRQTVMCGITGGIGRSETRNNLLEIGADKLVSNSQLIVDLSPSQILQTGLPYLQSDIAIILGSAIFDVPNRYRDPERAARLVSVVADAVPKGGAVVCPENAHLVHDLVRDAGRHVVKFAPDNDIHEHAHRAAVATVTALQAMSTTHHA